MNDSDFDDSGRQSEPLLGANTDDATAFGASSVTATRRSAVEEEDNTTPLLEENENSSDDTVAAPSLSLPLWTMYCLDGISLALPMTALLYIVNERVQIPVSLLSSYAALSFLPCSLKPLYAALSVFLSKQFGLPRHNQIAILLTLCATANAASIGIPPHAIVTCFAMAFVRCLLQSWPEFLYGLTLIDEAVAYETKRSTRQRRLRHLITSSLTQRRRVESGNNIDNDSYAETAALFQSQSATARSIGCVTSHLLVLVFFVTLPWIRRHRPDSTTTVATAATATHVLDFSTMAILMLATAAFNVIGAIVAWTCRLGETCTVVQSASRVVASSSGRTAPRPRRQPSYDSLLDGDGDNGDPLGAMEMDTARQQGPVERVQSPHENGQSPRPVTVAAHDNPMTGRRRNIWLIVVLQLVAIIFSMRQPVIHASSRTCWNVLAIGSVLVLLGVGIGVMGWYKSSSSQRDANANAATHSLHGVGLFLILRHAIPSVSYLMSSYYYTVFAKKMPSFLQVLSLWDMMVTTAACWTYGKFFSKYSRGRPLQWLMAGTTVLAAVTSLGNVALLRVLDPESKSRFSWTFKIALTIIMKTVLGFTSEWKFLPDIVLATTSVDAMTTATATAVTTTTRSAPLAATSCREDGSNVDADGSSTDPLSTPLLNQDVVSDAELDNGQRHDCSRQSSTSNSSNSNSAIGLHYGTLVSCIDFGGQLGALSAGPLVALFGTTRDNDWAHLDWLQVANSILMVSSLVFLVLLNHRPR